ncbi:hypothetical protein BDN72DRAFT_309456 [Pluteus cervinus]|uniref:Uncharacterized protein n=1 Tax=Pluteus cervinus TaxID=181527 RepID=A0ACD3ADA3_9AGAR|nr:hypothetical protein BDN72DRAFT_309456 [Pluteus cervinus]
MAAQLSPNLASFNIHGLTLADAYQKLDQEIGQLQERLSALRTLRNSLSPISKMPTEILSKIFSDSQQRRGSSFPDDADLDTRFFISWVCRHWRNIALATPNLWTIISRGTKDTTMSIEFAKDLLVRSRNLGLSINLYLPDSELLKAFAAHMHRIQHMRLKNGSGSDESDDFFSKAAPLLSSLELEDAELPDELEVFSEIHPQLRHLSVSRMDLSTPSPLFSPTLSSLYIYRMGDSMDIDYLLDVLPLMQNLAELEITQSFDDADVVIPTQCITLPRLVSFILSDDCWGTVFGFLRCFDIPQTTITLTWSEEIEGTDEMTNDLNEFLFDVEGYLGEILYPFRHLKVREESSAFVIDISSSASQHRYSFRFPGQQVGQQYVDIFINRALPLRNLETLSVAAWPEIAAHRLGESLNLTKVTVFGNATLQGFVDDFNQKTFPAVKELVICDIEPLLFGYSRLEGALTTRYAAGVRLDKLVFMRCPGMRVNKFGKLVDEILIRN